MPATKILNRENIEERIPFCFGMIQRLADDLNVSHTAVRRFLNQPENHDLLETVKSEKKRIREYAEMTVIKRLLGGDIETAKWYLTAFPSNGARNKLKPYKPKKAKDDDYFIVSIDSHPDNYRQFSFPALDHADRKLPGSAQYLPYEKEEPLRLQKGEPSIKTENEPGKELEKEIEQNMKLREKNAGKSGHEIYEEFKKNWKR